MHRKVVAALVAALALVVASCGSSGPEQVSRAELVRRVEIACSNAARETRARPATRGETRREQVVRFAETLYDVQKETLDGIDGLEPPSAAKADFQAFKQALRDRMALLDGVKKAGGAVTMRTVVDRGEAITRRFKAANAALGVSGCS